MSRNKIPKIAWDHDKRLSLVLLRDEFQLEWQQLNDVFLDIHQDITAKDIRGALRAQEQERRRRKQIAWIDFHNLVVPPEEFARRKSLITERIATRERPKSTHPSKNHLRSHVPTLQQPPAPLSRQAPVAVLKRKRDFDDSSDDEIRVAPATNRDRYASPQAEVQVQIRRRLLPSSQNRIKSPKKRILQGTKTPYRQTNGLTIQISPKSAAKMQDDLASISDEEAHPPRSISGLFFRYTNADVEPHDSKTGFTARRFRDRVKMHQAPPTAANLCWTDVFYHIDPTGRKIEYDSPFVSVSDKLWWIIRLALKEMHNGVINGQISIINAAALDPRGVYHLLPYHRQLKKKYEFTGGAWNYAGTHEYLCWKEIPGHAILSTFSVRELFDFVNATPHMSRALRLSALASGGGYGKTVLPGLKQDEIQITPNLVTAIAGLAEFVGLDALSRAEHLAHIWTDITQGWGLRLTYKEPGEWIQLAARFARSLGDASNRILPSRDSKPLELAFLEGVKWACGNPHIRFDDSHIRWKDAQARRFGLADPVGLVSGEGVTSVSVRERLQSYQHQPQPASIRVGGADNWSVHEKLRIHQYQTINDNSALGRAGVGSRAAAAGKRLREVVGIEYEEEEIDTESHSDDHDDDGEEIRFDY